MAIDTSTFEGALQTKLDAVTDAKEMLLLGKALESTVGSIAVSDITTEGNTKVAAVNTAGTTQVSAVNSAGTTQVAAVNAIATGTFKTVGGSSILGSGDITIVTSAGLQSQQVFTASGTWTKPSGITKIKVTVTGGGAGGGSGSSGNNQGGGGGAGGTAIEIIDVSSVSTVSVTVGAGGGRSASGDDKEGNDGATSSFGSYCTGNGGYRGNHSHQARAWYHSLGGAASGGQINLPGGPGGASGGDNAQDGPGAPSGGASFWGGGSTGGSEGNVSSVSVDAQVYGAGGGGGDHSSGVSNPGAAGKSGIVVIEEYK